jgi:hypothetical protein
MLVWPLHGYGEWLAVGIRLLCPLSLKTNSLCVGSKVTVHMYIVSNKVRTVSVLCMNEMALLVAVVVASIGTGQDAVDVILIVMLSVPLRMIGPYARISTVALSFLVFNARHVSVLGTRLLAVTCWPLRCS